MTWGLSPEARARFKSPPARASELLPDAAPFCPVLLAGHGGLNVFRVVVAWRLIEPVKELRVLWWRHWECVLECGHVAFRQDSHNPVDTCDTCSLRAEADMDDLYAWEVRCDGRFAAGGKRTERFDALHLCGARVLDYAGAFGATREVEGTVSRGTRVLHTLKAHPDLPGWVLSQKVTGEVVPMLPVPLDAPDGIE